jgi:hypothetical protein
MPSNVLVGFVAFLMFALAVLFLTQHESSRSWPRGERASSFGGKAGVTTRRLQYMPGEMPHMMSQDPLIDFVGTRHMAFTEWQSTDGGEWQHRHVLTRSGWQKTTKCVGNSSMACQECSGDFDCWTNAEGSRKVQLADEVQDGVRYVSTVHVRCSSPTLHVQYEVQNLLFGRFRILWDGEEVNKLDDIEASGLSLPQSDLAGTYQENHKSSERSGSLVISAERMGAHTLEMEFTPFSGKLSRVEISHLQLSMPQEFVECADYNTCLDPISTSLEFRNSNAEQLKCLQESVPHSADCARWKSCLSADHQNQLRTMLLAAGIGGFDLNVSSIQVNASNVSSSQRFNQNEDGTECINPLTQDVESWTCDCFEGMLSACNALGSYDEVFCMRAQICEHPRVCHAWKEQACDEPAIQAMQDAIAVQRSVGAQRRALFSRMEAGAGDEVFDRALGGKDSSCL